MTITLRPVMSDDAPFLLRVYAGTREEELAFVDWSAEQKQAFIAMQFRAQDSHYRAHYDGASYDVILVDGAPSGRLYVARWPSEIRIMDIALLPEYRGRGIGTTLLNGLQAEAAEADTSLSIHVECFNPAQRLYSRLGFEIAGEHGVYLRMEWRPPQ
jgi:ribosomal protein S18 acetylase RimI-like enzyme